jgi:parvulin-like peptidyl-prolyl isomerase
MNMKFFLFCFLAGLLALAGGCNGKKLPQGKFTDEQMKQIPLANTYNLPPASGGMVLAVYSDSIGANEILDMCEKALRPAAAQMEKEAFDARAIPYIREAVRGKVTDILVYQEAVKQAPDNIEENLEKAIKTETSRFIASYNNNYALAEKKIKEMGMDWRSFHDYQKKLIMTQSYVSTTLKEDRRFSYQELTDYYNRIRAEQFCETGIVEFSLIDIIPAELKPEQIPAGQTAEQAARQLAQEALTKAQAGEDFAGLAKQYSHGPLAAVGGKMMPVTVGAGSLAKPYDVLEAAAIQMQPGELKGPIENEGHLFIVKLTDYKSGGCKSFEEVQGLIEDQMQFEYHQKQYTEFVNRLVRKANITQMERFVGFCSSEAWRRWSPGGTQAKVN